VEDDLLALDVIAEPEAAEGEPPAGLLDALELLDLVGPAAVIRVSCKDRSARS
jgi:hypothetical protein